MEVYVTTILETARVLIGMAPGTDYLTVYEARLIVIRFRSIGSALLNAGITALLSHASVRVEVQVEVPVPVPVEVRAESGSGCEKWQPSNHEQRLYAQSQ